MRTFKTTKEELINKVGYGMAIVLLEDELDEDFWSEVSAFESVEIWLFALPGTEIEKRALEALENCDLDFDELYELYEIDYSEYSKNTKIVEEVLYKLLLRKVVSRPAPN